MMPACTGFADTSWLFSKKWKGSSKLPTNKFEAWKGVLMPPGVDVIGSVYPTMVVFVVDSRSGAAEVVVSVGHSMQDDGLRAPSTILNGFGGRWDLSSAQAIEQVDHCQESGVS